MMEKREPEVGEEWVFIDAYIFSPVTILEIKGDEVRYEFTNIGEKTIKVSEFIGLYAIKEKEIEGG